MFFYTRFLLSKNMQYKMLKEIKKSPRIYGIWKTNEITLNMANIMYTFLSRDKINFSKDIATYSRKLKHDKNNLKEEILTQLKNYKRIPILNNGLERGIEAKYRLSGKKYGPDDLLISLLMCGFWINANIYSAI